MLSLHRTSLVVSAAALLLVFFLYASLGVLKPEATWQWLDIIGEGGTALLCGVWLVMMLSARPAGAVTSLLTIGLAGLMLGAWADCMDEFYKLSAVHVWDNWLEAACTLGGGLTLTAGLYFYRIEQLSLNEHLTKRERLFRDHRAFDRVTQLANADYLRKQLKAELDNAGTTRGSLILLDIDGFHAINREHGTREGDRVLQAVTHLLLLNVRRDDLVCRYAGDRFAVLLPATDTLQTLRMAEHLRRMIALMRHYPKAGNTPVSLSARHVCAAIEGNADALLDTLNQRLEAAGSGGGGAVRAQPLSA